MIKKIISILIISLFLALNLGAVNWETDYESCMQKAKIEHKPVMLCFYTDACGYCKKLEKETLNDPTVAKVLERFISVHINLDKRPDLGKKYLIRGVPVVLFISADGKKDWMVGYRTPESFLQELNRFLEIMDKE